MSTKERNIANMSKALREKSDFYPPAWYDRVPLKVEMAKTVTSDLPAFFQTKPQTIAHRGHQYYVTCNRHGALAAILPNGEKLGIKPYEFVVIAWHEE